MQIGIFFLVHLFEREELEIEETKTTYRVSHSDW